MDEKKNGFALYAQGVYKDYGPKRVLQNISLRVKPGEFVTVVGPSGCGKSTLLRLILGQEPPTAGQINVCGEEKYCPSSDRGIVYQRYSLYPHLTVLENIMLGGSLRLTPWQSWRQTKQLRAEALDYLAKIELTEHADKLPQELSGGMQQRVAIAQALFTQPKVLLMDEPFGALDPGMREAMQVLILRIWVKYGMTIFFVTHDLEEAVFLGTRIIAVSQHYRDKVNGNGAKHGARIVADYQLPRTAMATTVKETAEFGQLIQQIRKEAFDPRHLQDTEYFNLKHPDAFTLPDQTEEEINGGK